MDMNMLKINSKYLASGRFSKPLEKGLSLDLNFEALYDTILHNTFASRKSKQGSLFLASSHPFLRQQATGTLPLSPSGQRREPALQEHPGFEGKGFPTGPLTQQLCPRDTDVTTICSLPAPPLPQRSSPPARRGLLYSMKASRLLYSMKKTASDRRPELKNQQEGP